ncbi:MAG: ABC transporter substrate-binding protein [Ruminococcus flavefaciens]|nr:ABC transporter substrate-binding protein [Ruminococcus flavefaciens]
MIKKILSALCACSLLCLSSSCSNDTTVQSHIEQTEIKLSWWGNDARNEYTIKAVERFEELHPDIKVKCSYSEWSGYEARCKVQMNSDTEADVMQINFNWLSEYSPDGSGYYDISELSDIVDLSCFSDDMLDYGRINGRLNAIPIAMNAETLYINKTVYEKYGLDIPQTWDDLFNSAKVMKKDGVYPIAGAWKSVCLYIITYTEQQSGKTFLDENGKLNFNQKDLKTMIDFYVRLVEEKVIPQAEYFERLNIDSGKYAGVIAWVSDAVNYCGGAIENDYEITVADYTADTPENCGKGWCAKPATMYTVSKNTEHPEESAMLLDFLLNSEDMALLQGIEKGIPLSTSAREYLESAEMLDGIQYEASLKMENNETMEQLNPFIENESLIDLFAESCNRVLYKRMTSEESTEKLFSDIKSKY